MDNLVSIEIATETSVEATEGISQPNETRNKKNGPCSTGETTLVAVLCSDSFMKKSEDLTNAGDSCVSTTNDTDAMVPSKPQIALNEIKCEGGPTTTLPTEETKRMRDKLKKRELRLDPTFRQKESERARTRMAEIRQDPAYRESERQKDCERRPAAKQRKDFHDRERERDRQYKRSQRHVPEHNSVTSGPHSGEVSTLILSVTSVGNCDDRKKLHVPDNERVKLCDADVT